MLVAGSRPVPRSRSRIIGSAHSASVVSRPQGLSIRLHSRASGSYRASTAAGTEGSSAVPGAARKTKASPVRSGAAEASLRGPIDGSPQARASRSSGRKAHAPVSSSCASASTSSPNGCNDVRSAPSGRGSSSHRSVSGSHVATRAPVADATTSRSPAQVEAPISLSGAAAEVRHASATGSYRARPRLAVPLGSTKSSSDPVQCVSLPGSSLRGGLATSLQASSAGR